MNGQWTFSHSLFVEWVHSTFDTKEKAIKEGREFFGKNFLIGQLSELKDGRNYTITNIEEVDA
jgi:hypothetical protein